MVRLKVVNWLTSHFIVFLFTAMIVYWWSTVFIPNSALE